jgi:DNA-binding PadR family transcriptional regulator
MNRVPTTGANVSYICNSEVSASMYELMILSLLMRGPMHGYSISKIMNDMIGPVLKVSHGSLYPRLRKLEEDGLVTASEQVDDLHNQDSTRQVRVFAITGEGRRRFHELMMDTTTNPGEYTRLFWQKVCFLLKAITKNVVENKAHYHDMNLPQLELTLHALRRATSHWQVEAEFTASLREKVLAKMLVDAEL